LARRPARLAATKMPAGKRSVNRTYHSAARFVRLSCQEVRHGKETGKYAST
jgi:hypothetical protein